MSTTPTPEISRRRITDGDRLFWGILLIWAALVVGADGLGLLPRVGSADLWNWIFLGAGIMATAGCIRRRLADRQAEPDLWSWAVAGALLVVGLGGFVSSWAVTSAVMLVFGLLVLAAGPRRGYRAAA